jgi:hypothetical protein
LALHYTEEDADEVVAVPADKTEAVIRELEANTRRRAVRCAVDAIVPEGYLRSPEKTYQDLVGWQDSASGRVERPRTAQ